MTTQVIGPKNDIGRLKDNRFAVLADCTDLSDRKTQVENTTARSIGNKSKQPKISQKVGKSECPIRVKSSSVAENDVGSLQKSKI